MVNYVSFFEFLRDVLYGNAQLDHQHHDVVSQVADLVDGLLPVALGACNDDLGGFLTDLFEDLFQALVEQIGGVAALLRVGLAALDEFIQPLPGELLQLIGDIDRVEEAALRAGVAGGAGFDDVDDERVLVAVGGDGDDPLHVAGGLALAPDLPAAAGPEYGAALGNRQGQRLGIHVGEGQHLFGIMVLHDGRDQAVCVKFESLGILGDFHGGHS